MKIICKKIKKLLKILFYRILFKKNNFNKNKINKIILLYRI